MRTKIFKINGKQVEGILVAGIPKLVKIYDLGQDKFWLQIKNQIFTLQDEPNRLLLKFINLKYQPINEQEKIFKDFKKLCEDYL